ncbi:Aminoglycoside phosphotransferase [Prunus yedoensis var. nudiflora]|uniref:Aminoglycoside phosphotransferase n=1 Tax=Prunus yedoensis var. nudiflora TaxID=2094558 RepID=A0A314XFP2_PRUYE|nr:Aminoglycoside phosphotransferase [Prunus yedoensis var. nudiflora]
MLALSELHDQIPPFPRDVAMKIIEEELGSPAESLFSYISGEPEAAASFGQVYRGRTLDGFNVAIKVQRPNMRHIVVRDIYILRLGLGILQKIAKRKGDLRLYADELGKGLVGELDYTLEASNSSKFLEAHSSFPFMFVPKIFQQLSRKRVLTMEWIVGESPTDLLSVSAGSSIDNGSTYSERQRLDAKRRLLDLVKKGVEACLVQLLETGLLHADPHPGNLRYTSSGQIGFLDFGLLCQMEKKHQFAMLASIVHIVNGDWASLVNSLTEMDVVRPGTNIRRVTMDLEYELGEVEFRDGIPDVKFSRVLGKIWSIAFKYHFRMPPYYSLVLRSLASFEGLAVAADKNFKTFEAAYPYVVRKLLTENSAATRKILHSVVFNKKKEFQWQRLALFLKVGATRKGLHGMIASKADSSLGYLPLRDSGAVDVANLVLRLLPSKDGVVLRRLLMTADGASLVQAMVSKEAKFFRQQFCSVIADILYQWMFAAFGRGITTTQYGSDLRLASAHDNRDLEPSSRTPIYDYRTIFRDRRLKVIFSNGAGAFSGFTRLCKGLAVVLIGGHIVVQFLPQAVNYLALIPARTIPFVWNLLTAGYIEQSVYGVVVSTLGLLFIGKLLEPVWGSREFLKFIFIVNFLTSICTFITAIALYYITMNENYLYLPLSGFHGVLSGFLVGIKQIIPDQELPLLKIKSKWLPSLSLLLSIAISFWTAQSATYLPILIFGTYLSWIYLRYWQRKPETKLKGDPSDDFAFSTFFPEFLRPVIDPVASIFHRMLCGRFDASSESQGYTLGGTTLPGSDPIEASRRRERGARALEERLAAERLGAAQGTEESGRDATESV